MDSPSTLIYPSEPSDNFSNIHQDFSDDILDQDFDYRQFEFNGSVTSIIDIEGINISEDDLLIAYVDDKIRGKTSPLLFPLTNKFIFPLMVYSNEVLENDIEYLYYNSLLIKYFILSSDLNFEKDMIIGNGITPYRFSEVLGEVSIKEISISTAHPNPFNPTTNINYVVNQPTSIKVTIFDVAGRVVDVVEDGYKAEGNYSLSWNAINKSSGIYYISIQTDNNIYSQKVVLLK